MTDEPRRLELFAGRRQGGEGRDDIYDDLMDAIDGASDQDQITWVTHDGKPLCAIVPVDVAEDVLSRLAEVLAHVGRAPTAAAPDADGNIPTDEPPYWRPPDPEPATGRAGR